MAKADRAPIPMYRVWDPLNEDRDEGGREYGALDVACAAELYADYYYRRRDGHELKWPVTFHVFDPTDNKTYAVSIELDMEPVFRAGKPEAL